MAAKVKDWLTEKVFPWPEPTPPVNKVDVHHHWVPTSFAKAVEDAGGDPSGWPMPSWSLKSSELLMGHIGASTAILSITAPGVCILDGPASHALARSLNEEAAEIRDKQPQKFGFFATLPSLLDTTAALEEIGYALDKLNADGVCLYTRYGAGHTYLGHKDIEPIWQELDRRGAVVFVHPTHPADTGRANEHMPQPMIDYPHETTRTAMDMLISGTLHKYSNVKVILSHAGGNLPWIIGRVATPLSMTPPLVGKASGMTHGQLLKDFRAFYFDIALSATPATLNLLLNMVPNDHILYGVSIPRAS